MTGLFSGCMVFFSPKVPAQVKTDLKKVLEKGGASFASNGLIDHLLVVLVLTPFSAQFLVDSVPHYLHKWCRR